MPIQILSDEVVNQIAAGEVVERPSHMVKELVENSLDSGATEISVDLNNGGRDVRVTDNGSGISRQELELSVQRHATSKIAKTDDIWNVNSFGFRGEALASIASVSEMTVYSRPAGSEGAKIQIDFGKLSSAQASGGDFGTVISVGSLFKNIPARMKFLKSDAAELTQVKNTLKALAMAHPNVSFRVRSNEKLLFYWPGVESLKERVESVLEVSSLHETSTELGRFKMRAVVSSPNKVVHQARQIWLFVRGRHVQDRNLQYAVLEAYRGLLMHGEYPIAAIFVECPPAEVDVNIHPTKSQVKFREPQSAFRVVHRGIRELLERAPWLEALRPMKKSELRPEVGTSAIPQNQFSQPEFQRTQFSAPSSPGVSLADLERAAPSFQRTSSGETQNPRWSDLQVLSQANLTYILTQNDSSLILVDQHAAHERVLFETLMRDWKSKSTDVQTLLIPLSIDLEEEDVQAMQPHFAELSRFGIEIEAMGPSNLAVRSMPSMIKEEALDRALRQMAEEVKEQGESFSLEKAMSEIFATMACHSAIRAGQVQSFEQMQSLLQQMDEFPLSSFCPHGRPVFVELSFPELERRFGRIV